MNPFAPRHTFDSVAKTLATGLADGSIVLDSPRPPEAWRTSRDPKRTAILLFAMLGCVLVTGMGVTWLMGAASLPPEAGSFRQLFGLLLTFLLGFLQGLLLQRLIRAQGTESDLKREVRRLMVARRATHREIQELKEMMRGQTQGSSRAPDLTRSAPRG